MSTEYRDNVAPSIQMSQNMREENCRSRYQNAYIFDNVLTIIGFKRSEGILTVCFFHNRDCKSSLWFADVLFKVALGWGDDELVMASTFLKLTTEHNYIMLQFQEARYPTLRTAELRLSCMFKEFKGMRLLPLYNTDQAHSRYHMRFKFPIKWFSVNKTVLDMESPGFSSKVLPTTVVTHFGCSTEFEVFLSFLFNSQIRCTYTTVTLKMCLNFATMYNMNNVISRIERFMCLRNTSTPDLKLLIASQFTLRNLEVAALREITSVEYCRQLLPILPKLDENVLRDIVRKMEFLHCRRMLRDSEVMREKREMVHDDKEDSEQVVRSCLKHPDQPFPRWEEVILNTGYVRNPTIRSTVYLVKPEDSLKPITHTFPINRNNSNMWSKTVIYHLHVIRDVNIIVHETVTINHYHEDVVLTEPTLPGVKVKPAKKYITVEETISQNACWWEEYDGVQPAWPREEEEEFVTIRVNETDIVFQKKKLLHHSAEFAGFLECESVSLPSHMTVDNFLQFFNFAYLNTPCSFKLINEYNIRCIAEVATWFRAHKVIESVQQRLLVKPMIFANKFEFLQFGARFCLPAVQTAVVNSLRTVQLTFEAIEDVNALNRASLQCIISHLARFTSERPPQVQRNNRDEQLFSELDIDVAH